MSKRAEPDSALFRADWQVGLLITEICQRHTMTKDQVVRLRVRLDLPPRLDRSARKRAPPFSVPDEDEIASRVAAIKAGWSDSTRLKRAGIEEKPYEIPTGVETPEGFDPSWYD